MINNIIIETERLYLMLWKADKPFSYTLEIAQSFIKNIKNRTKNYFVEILEEYNKKYDII